MTQHFLITGATSAISSALALAYAAPGVTLVLHGRREDVLDGLWVSIYLVYMSK